MEICGRQTDRQTVIHIERRRNKREGGRYFKRQIKRVKRKEG